MSRTVEILIIDQSMTLQHVYRHFLDDFSPQVIMPIFAAHPQEGLARWRTSSSMRLILADVATLGDGLGDFIRALEEDAQLRRIPLFPVVLTGTEDELADAFKDEAVGASLWLEKPIVAERLHQLLREVLSALQD